MTATTRPSHLSRLSLLLIALLLFAFGVLALTLLWQSLWLDEVFSIWYVNRPFDDAWQKAIFPEQNPHATLYYLLFWGWVKALGTSDFVARYFSLGFSMLSLATAYRLARDWMDRRAALLVALLLAVSPFAVWYGQEARQYAQYLFLGLFSTLCLSRAFGLHAPQPHWRARYGAAYVIAAAALAYSHYFSLFFVAAQFIGALIALLRQRKLWLPLIGLGGAVAALCAPIPLRLLGSGRTFDQADITRAFTPPWEMLREMMGEYVLRVDALLSPEARWLVLIGAGALMLLGLISLLRTNRRAGVLAVCLALIPPLLYLPFSTRVSIFTPKYVMACFPFFVMALAAGLSAARRWRRRAGATLVLAVVAVFGWGTLRDLTHPDVQRENWRFAAGFLGRTASPDDGVLVFADYSTQVLAHYYPRGATLTPFAGDPGNPGPMFDQMQQRPGRMLWLVLSHDQNAYPNHRILDVAYARYPWAYAKYPSQGNIRLLGFTLRWRRDQLPEGATPVAEARFSNGMELIGYQIDQNALPATDRVSHPPSNWIHVVTYWRRWRAVDPAGAQPGIRLVGGDSGEWGGELSRRPNVFDFDPPEKWGEGDIIEAHYDINLNPVTPAGTYTLEVRMMKDDQRLPLDGSDATALPLTPIEIVP